MQAAKGHQSTADVGKVRTNERVVLHTSLFELGHAKDQFEWWPVMDIARLGYPTPAPGSRCVSLGAPVCVFPSPFCATNSTWRA